MQTMEERLTILGWLLENGELTEEQRRMVVEEQAKAAAREALLEQKRMDGTLPKIPQLKIPGYQVSRIKMV